MLFCPLQRGLGAPGREPVVTEDEQKKMMAYYYKKQEEFKVCTTVKSLFYASTYFYDFAILYQMVRI